MQGRNRMYACPACGFRGVLEETEAGHAAECPRCGTHIHPETFASTWGVALLVIFATVGVVFAACWYVAQN